MYYAQINEKKICIGLSSLSGEVNNPNLIKLDTYDTDVLDKKYEDGQWVEVKIRATREVSDEPLSDMEQAIMQATLNTECLLLMAEGGM